MHLKLHVNLFLSQLKSHFKKREGKSWRWMEGEREGEGKRENEGRDNHIDNKIC